MVFEKGHIKSGGKKKGSVNKVTALQRRLRETPDQRGEIMEQLWGLALGIRDNGCANACRVWLNEYNKQADDVMCTAIETEVNTLDDIKNTGAKITQMMLRNELSLDRGAKAHDALTKQKSYIEAQLTPIVDALIKERLDQMKMKD